MQKWQTTEAIKGCNFLLQNFQLFSLDLEVRYVTFFPPEK